MRKLSLALSLLLLAGCAKLNSAWQGNVVHYNDPYAQSDFDDLLGFGANMAQIPSSSRASICQTLLKGQKNSPGTGIKLHLMVGRLFSDACGDISDVLNGVDSIPVGSLSDVRLQRFVIINKEILKRMTVQPRKRPAAGRKQKSTQSVRETKDTAESKKDETRMLREKLEAIRSMEKQLDDNEGGN